MSKYFREFVLPVLRAGVGIFLAAVLILLTFWSAGAKVEGKSMGDLLITPSLIAHTMAFARELLQRELTGAIKPLLLTALLLYGTVVMITVWRWSFLLRIQGVHLRAWDLIRLTMIGVFFNLAIPGAVSGDLVKMAFIARQVPHKNAECILTVIVDRIMGILGLFFLASLMVILNLPFLLEIGESGRVVQVAAFTVGLGSVGGILGILALEFQEELLRLPVLAAGVAKAARHLPAHFVATVTRVTGALNLYRKHRRAVLFAILLSVLVHSGLGLTLFCIGRSLGEKELTMREYFLTTQVANSVASIPLTPAGLGLRDFGIKAFLKAMEATPGKAGSIPITFTLIMLFWGLVGGAVFVFSPRVAPTLNPVTHP